MQALVLDPVVSDDCRAQKIAFALFAVAFKATVRVALRHNVTKTITHTVLFSRQHRQHLDVLVSDDL